MQYMMCQLCQQALSSVSPCYSSCTLYDLLMYFEDMPKVNLVQPLSVWGVFPALLYRHYLNHPQRCSLILA